MKLFDCVYKNIIIMDLDDFLILIGDILLLNDICYIKMNLDELSIWFEDFNMEGELNVLCNVIKYEELILELKINVRYLVYVNKYLKLLI